MGGNILTGVDRLLNLVNDKKQISITQAANHFKISTSVVDSWADTLEDAKMISTKYTLRDRYLMSLSYMEAEKVSSSVFIQLKSLLSNGKSIHDIDMAKKEKELNQKMQEVQLKLRELNMLSSNLSNLDELKNRLKDNDDTINKLRKDLEIYQKKSEKLSVSLKAKDDLVMKREKELMEKQNGLYIVLKSLENREEALQERIRNLVSRETRLSEYLKQMIKQYPDDLVIQDMYNSIAANDIPEENRESWMKRQVTQES